MGRPSKSVNVIKLEGKSHRTKAELAARESAEKSTLTRVKIREKEYIKRDIIAHREFLRIKKLLESIGKNDALYENAINRYCQIYSECISLEGTLENILLTIEELDRAYKDPSPGKEMDLLSYVQTKNSLFSKLSGIDRQIHTKRDMMLRIEKENLMTIAAALRSVPKNPPAEVDPHADMFG